MKHRIAIVTITYGKGQVMLNVVEAGSSNSIITIGHAETLGAKDYFDTELKKVAVSSFDEYQVNVNKSPSESTYSDWLPIRDKLNEILQYL